MKISVIDVETTGLPPSKRRKDIHVIVEIGIAEIDFKTGKIEKLFDSVVKDERFDPVKYKDAWLFDNKYMDIQEVIDGPSFNELKPEIQQIMNKNPITAFNQDFDFYFLKEAGLEINWYCPCIMKSATNHIKIPQAWGGYKWPSVEEAWVYYYDEPYTELHRGGDDVIHELQILYRMYQLGQYEPTVSY